MRPWVFVAAMLVVGARAGCCAGLDGYLGLPYRDDGALDERGRYTLFADPTRTFDTPGLNCSGFVTAASRDLLSRPVTLETAKRDRQGNSGKGAPLGEDWDFGFDLILNLTDGLPRRAVLPGGRAVDPRTATGETARGFPIADRAAWADVLAQMQPGRVYFASISRPVKKPGYKLLHYHVAVIVPDASGRAWCYHATPKSGVHRMDLRAPEGLALFQGEFRDKAPNEKHILIIEAEPTGP